MAQPIVGTEIHIRNMPNRLTAWERECQRSLSQSSPLELKSDFYSEKAGMPYGKTEALRDVWREATKIDLSQDDCPPGSFMACKLSPDPYASMQTALQLKEKGLDGSVNWNSVSGDFSKIGGSANAENLKETIDYFASRYVALADQICRNNSGEALEVQLAKLNEVFAESRQKFAGDYTARLQKALSISDDAARNIESSLEQMIDQRIGEYQEIQKTLNVSFQPDEQWLQNYDKYMAAQLRQAGKDTQASSTEGEITLTDLQWASKIAGSYQTMYSSASGSGKHHAEFYVMNAAFVDMKTETLIGSGVLSQKMSTILGDSMENRHKQIAEIANTPSRNGQVDYNQSPSLNYDRFCDVYDRILDVFHQTGDVMSSIREGGTYIQNTAGSTPVQYRYEDFFTSSGAHSKGTKYKDYERSWTAFQNALENQSVILPQTMLSSIPHFSSSQYVDFYA